MMNTTVSTTSIQASAAKALNRLLLAAFLAVGPLASLLALGHFAGASWLPVVAVRPAMLGVLFMWSPMPVSIPALCLQSARDAALPQYRGVVGTLIRATRLVGYLMVSSKSPVRLEMTASVVGFFAALIWFIH